MKNPKKNRQSNPHRGESMANRCGMKSEEIDALREEANRCASRSLELFAEAQRLQRLAAEQTDEAKQHEILKTAHSIDMEAIAFIRESNFWDHKLAERLRKENLHGDTQTIKRDERLNGKN